MPESTLELPAPPTRPKEGPKAQPESQPKPQPAPKQESVPMPQLPQNVKEVVVGVAATKSQIEGDGRKGQEVLEQAGIAGGRKRMTEEKEVWEKKFNIKRLAKRIWQDGIHQRALYSREKATAQQMMAEGGIQSIPYNFQREVRAAAADNVAENHRGEKGIKRLGTRAKDFIKQATLAQRELHHQEVAVMKNLRLGLQYQGVDVSKLPDAQKQQAIDAQKFATDHSDLFNSYKNVLTGDYQALESVAQRLRDDMGDDALRTAIGEKKAGGVEITGELSDFYKNEVILPFLKKGLQNNGTISPEELLKIRTRIDEGLPALAKWRKSLGEGSDAQNAIDPSLSYATDLILVMQEVLPQLQGVKDQLLAGENLKTYVDEMVLHANVGTLKAGAETTVKETKLEKWSTRRLTEKRVKKKLDDLAAGRETRPLQPKAYNDSLEPSSRTANFYNDLFKFGGGHVMGGLLAGVTIYAAQRAAGWGGRVVLPILGGSAVAGGLRAAQEHSRYSREVEQHQRETAEGVQFHPDAKRRNEMDTFNLPMVNIQEAINPLVEGRLALEGGTASQDDLARLLGAMADRQARITLMNQRGVDLYRTTSDISLDEQRTNLTLESARAAAALRSYFDNNQHASELQVLSRRFRSVSGNVQVDPNNIVSSFTKEIANLRRENLVRGTALDANVAIAFGGSVEVGASIEKREHAMKVARGKAMLKQGAGTFTTGVIGSLVFQEAAANVVRLGHAITDHIGPPRETVLEHTMPWVHEPKVQHFPGEALAPMKAATITEPLKVNGSKVNVTIPQDLIPKGVNLSNVHVVENANHFSLVDARGHHIVDAHMQGKNVIIDHAPKGVNLKQLSATIHEIGNSPPTHEPVLGENGQWTKNATNTGTTEWLGNNTQVSDLNELDLHDYIRHDGQSVVLKAQAMTPGGSYNSDLISPSYNMPLQISEGHAVAAFTLPGSDQKMLVYLDKNGELPLNLNGNNHNETVTLWSQDGKHNKKMSIDVLSQMLINKDEVHKLGLSDGDIATEVNTERRAIFRFSECNIGVVKMVDGKPVVVSATTIFGGGHPAENIRVPGAPAYNINIAETVIKYGPGRTENPLDVPIVPFPFWPRRPLEAGEELVSGPFKKEKSQQPKEPEIVEPFDYMPGYPEYNGSKGGDFEKFIKEWVKKHMSPTLKENPDAILDPYKEAAAYFDRQDPAYMDEIRTLAERLPQLSQSARAIVCIPVAGHQEGGQIYQTLKNYTTQNLPRDQFEIQLFVNRPAVDKQGKPTSSAETLAAIERFRSEYPDFPVTVLEKEFPPDQARIGLIRKNGADIALYRHLQRGPEAGDIILVSNDADQKGVVPTYLERFVKRFDEDPRIDAAVGQLDWDPEAYAEYPLIHVGTRLFQTINAIKRQRTGYRDTSGANSAIRGSMYAGIGGYIGDTGGGEDTAIGSAIKAARGRGNSKIVYVGGTRIYTSARRAIDALKSQVPPIGQWSMGFSAFDDEVRMLQLGQASKIDYDNPESVTELKTGLEWVINATLDRIYRGKDTVIASDQDLALGLRLLGIKYAIHDNKVTITNMDSVTRNLRDYREIAVLQRDVIAGNGGPEAKEQLRELRRKLRAAGEQLTPEAPVIPAEIRETLEPPASNALDKRLEAFNETEIVPLSDIPSLKYTLEQLQQSASKREVGDYVLCEDMPLDRAKRVIVGYNKVTGELMAFKKARSDDPRDPALGIQIEEAIKARTDNHTLFTYETKLQTADQIIRGYPLAVSDLQSYIDSHGPLDSQDALALVIEVSEGLRDLHKNGMYQFDVGGTNILIGSDGKIYLSDFDDLVFSNQLEFQQPFPGGNLNIMPPELSEGNIASGERVDIYEAATLLYHVISGKVPLSHIPWNRDEEADVRKRRFYEAHKANDFRIPDTIPASLKQILDRGLDPDPAKRYQSMDEMLNDLLAAYEVEKSKTPQQQLRQPRPAETGETTRPVPAIPETPPRPEQAIDVEAEFERIAREQGHAAQERLTEQSAQITDEEPRITALRNARLYLGRPLDNEERTLVENNPDNWGAELAWRMNQRERQRARPEEPPAPVDSAEGIREAGRAVQGILEGLEEPLREQQRQLGIAREFLNLDRLNTTVSNVITHGGNWQTVIQAAAGDRTLTPEQARQTFVRTAQDRGTALTEPQLGYVYDESVSQGRLINFRHALAPQVSIVQGDDGAIYEVARIFTNDRDVRMVDMTEIGGRGDRITLREEALQERLDTPGGEWRWNDALFTAAAPTSEQSEQQRIRYLEQAFFGTVPLSLELEAAIRDSGGRWVDVVREGYRELRGETPTPEQAREMFIQVAREHGSTLPDDELSAIMEQRVGQADYLGTNSASEASAITETAQSGAVELDSPDNLQEQLERGLESAANAGRGEGTFTLTPDTLTAYLRNNVGALFPAGSTIGDNFRMELGPDHILHIRGDVVANRRVGVGPVGANVRIPITFNDVELRIMNPERGEIEQIGTRDFRVDPEVNEMVRSYTNGQIETALQSINHNLRNILGQRIPQGWAVNQFAFNDDGTIGIRFRNNNPATRRAAAQRARMFTRRSQPRTIPTTTRRAA